MTNAVEKRRRRIAAAGVGVIAVLPLLAMLATPAGDDGRLIVVVPRAAAALPEAAALFDHAGVRPLVQGSVASVWLVAGGAADARTRLYEAGAWLVVAGNTVIAGCLGLGAGLRRTGA